MKRCTECGTVLWPILTGSSRRHDMILGRACPKCDRMDCWPTVNRELAQKARGPYDWERDGI